ncbi:TnsA-like heteromeric transposase endonuclease subunit [Cellulosimicrobium funkei]
MDWDWAKGAPRVPSLAPARRAAADALSRHAPVHMSCRTTGGFLVLESGLEHELARELDRDPDVMWIAAQPVLITFTNGSRHVPDLAAEHVDGRVVVWDARPAERRDEKFLRVAELTQQACTAVGWEYKLYDTADTTRRLNLMWLTCFRHRPEWPHHAAKIRLLEYAAASTTVGDLMALDQGDGHVIATMWHLLWAGDLVVDLDARITAVSKVQRREVADA